jgi:hypothetical protein
MITRLKKIGNTHDDEEEVGSALIARHFSISE